MSVPGKIQNICLSQLVLSPSNVRKTPATAAEDLALESSIRAHGILQNLIVNPAPIDGKGVYEVDAGGRRLKILQKLAAEGVIDGNYKIPCKIKKPEDAIETSLAENTVRAAMHPADEFEAMAALIEGGAMIEEVAKRFGTTERHVRQRLRLGKLAPELLDAYRGGHIALDTVTAFTISAGHEAQLAVWRQVKDQSWISPHTIRRLLTESAIPLDSDLGMFVGSQAYEAAGGTITRDLFSGDDDGFMENAALVQRLAIEKLEAKAAELRPQWAWTKAVLDLEYGALSQYIRVRPQPAEVPAELDAEIERIEHRLGDIEDITADGLTNELAAEADNLQERLAEIDEIIDGLAVYSDKDRARGGCIVTVGDRGDFCLHQGLLERRTTNDANHAGDDGIEDDSEIYVSPDARTPNQSPPHVSLTPEQTLRKQCGFSQLLVDDLKAHRHQITRAHLAANFEVAFNLALYTLCADLFRDFGYHARALEPLDLRAIEAEPRNSLNDLSGTPADRWLDAQKQALDLDWLQLPPAQGFEALAALPLDEKRRLFAWCIASTLKPQLAIETNADPVIEAAGHRLNIGFEDYWRPTADNYWGRAKKAHGLDTGRQILGERWAREHASDKKPVLAAALETAFDPQKSGACIALDRAARDNAAQWLPPGMAYAAVHRAAPEDDPHTDIDEVASIDSESAAIDPPAAGLPAFLTEDESEALDGASAA
jgi:ParB family transcriptional regulator, chromosome partitioning protein